MQALNITCGGGVSTSALRRSHSLPVPHSSTRPGRHHVQVEAACRPHRLSGTNVLATSIPECSMASYMSGQKARSSMTLAPVARGQCSGSRRRPSVSVSASWGAPVDFKPASVVSSKPVGDGLYSIAVDLSVEIASGYTKPGQYIQLKVGESKAGFFAIASSPDPNNAGVVQLLIKKTGNAEAAADLLIAAGPGATNVAVSPVQGKGFAVDRAPAAEYPSVVLFATGTGISPVKALIESDALKAAGRSLRLYYGARNPATAAFTDLLGAWKAQHGVDVVTVYSQDGQGYVQDVFKRDLEAGKVPGLPSTPDAGRAKVALVLCGQKGMCEAVTELAKERGVEADKVLLNF